MNLRTIALASAVVLMACGGETSSTEVPAPPVPPTVVALEVSPWHATITLGRTQIFVASKRMSNGSAIPVSAKWVSTSPDVATIDARGSAAAVGMGQSNIFASVDGLTAMGLITVKPPDNIGTSDALLVEEFSMIEFQSDSGQWTYAPQLRVRAAAGRAVTMLHVDFMILGLSAMTTWTCVAPIPSTGSSELNGELSGEWVLSIGAASRANGNGASADLTFVDETGKVATTSVYGAVVEGGFPLTRTGGNLAGACFWGFRPPG